MKINLYRELSELYRESGYLHSVGSGDLQSIEHAIAEAQSNWDVQPYKGDDDDVLDEEAVAFLAGAISSHAMCDYYAAKLLAEQVFVSDGIDNNLEDDEEEEDDADDEEIACPTCNGRGIQSLHGIALTSDVIAEWSQDELDDYRNGVYDNACDTCDGAKTVKRGEYIYQQERLAEMRAENPWAFQ